MSNEAQRVRTWTASLDISLRGHGNVDGQRGASWRTHAMAVGLPAGVCERAPGPPTLSARHPSLSGGDTCPRRREQLLLSPWQVECSRWDPHGEPGVGGALSPLTDGNGPGKRMVPGHLTDGRVGVRRMEQKSGLQTVDKPVVMRHQR